MVCHKSGADWHPALKISRAELVALRRWKPAGEVEAEAKADGTRRVPATKKQKARPASLYRGGGSVVWQTK
jgi:hypothetical protein